MAWWKYQLNLTSINNLKFLDPVLDLSNQILSLGGQLLAADLPFYYIILTCFIISSCNLASPGIHIPGSNYGAPARIELMGSPKTIFTIMKASARMAQYSFSLNFVKHRSCLADSKQGARHMCIPHSLKKVMSLGVPGVGYYRRTAAPGSTA